MDDISSGEEAHKKDASDKDFVASDSSGSNMAPLQKNLRDVQIQTEEKNEINKREVIISMSNN